MNLTAEFNLCDRAAALGVPFVPEGWEFRLISGTPKQPLAVMSQSNSGHDAGCVLYRYDIPTDKPVWIREFASLPDSSRDPEPRTQCVFVFKAAPIDAASWRDAASEWMANTDEGLYVMPDTEGRWYVFAHGSEQIVTSAPTRHAALVAAVTHAIEEKEQRP